MKEFMAIQKLRKFPAIVIFSYFKDNAFQQWKGCNVLN